MVRVRCGARGLRRAGRAEDRVAADEQGLGGGEHEGRDFRLPGHGGLVQAAAAVVMASVWELSAVQSLWHLSRAIRVPALHEAPYASFILD